MQFYSVKIDRIVPETPSSSSFYLAVAPEDMHAFSYKAGQYLTVRFKIGEKEHRRSYSLSSAPGDPFLRIGVKRVDGGLISNYMHDKLQAGDTMEVAAPEGGFGVALKEEKRRNHYFFAAGSGITPVLSLIRHTLEFEPKSGVYLLYGSRTRGEIMYFEELEELAVHYQGQFERQYCLSREGNSWRRMFAKKEREDAFWTDKKGRISGRTIDHFLEGQPTHGLESHYYFCGPGDLIEKGVNHLEASGVDSKHLHAEYFSSPEEAVEGGSQGQAASLVAHLEGERIELALVPGKTILQQLIDAGYDPPYSCTSGACATCVAKVLDGKVSMDRCLALDDDEVKEGWVLTCQSRAETDRVEIKY